MWWSNVLTPLKITLFVSLLLSRYRFVYPLSFIAWLLEWNDGPMPPALTSAWFTSAHITGWWWAVWLARSWAWHVCHATYWWGDWSRNFIFSGLILFHPLCFVNSIVFLQLLAGPPRKTSGRVIRAGSRRLKGQIVSGQAGVYPAVPAYGEQVDRFMQDNSSLTLRLPAIKCTDRNMILSLASLYSLRYQTMYPPPPSNLPDTSSDQLECWGPEYSGLNQDRPDC